MPLKAIIVVNSDHFFVSHRLAIGTALRELGIDVVVAAAETGGRRAIEREGLRFAPLPLARDARHPVKEALAVTALFELYRRERPSFVHHVTIKPVLYGSVAARALGIPTVNAISGLGYVFIEHDGLAHRALRAAAHAAYRVALGGARTRVIFQNPDDRERFVGAGLVARGRTVLIRGSGADTRSIRPRPLPEGDPVVLMPSRFLWDKGVRELIEATRLLRARGVRLRVALVGWSDAGNPAVVPAEQIAIWERQGLIESWGRCAPHEMGEVISRAHLVVLPSYREGLPLALVEAAAAGRACVTTNVPGCREIVRHGENGWLVPVRTVEPLADAIQEALADRDELVRRGERGRRMVEEEVGSPGTELEFAL